MMAGELKRNQKYEMQSVSQSFELLNILTNSRVAHTLSYLSDCLGMSKNKMFRLLATLEQRGVVEKFGSGWYRFGGTAFALARRIIESESVLNQARPIMAELAELFNESVYLATYKNGSALLQDMADCSQVIKAASFVGAELPCLQESGKLPAPSFQAIHQSFPGVLVSEGGLDTEITTVSAEFGDSMHSPAGALVVVAPSFRMTAGRIRSNIAPALIAGAQCISGLFGITPEQNNEVHKPCIRSGTNIIDGKSEFVLPINYQQTGSCHQPCK